MVFQNRDSLLKQTKYFEQYFDSVHSYKNKIFLILSLQGVNQERATARASVLQTVMETV